MLIFVLNAVWAFSSAVLLGVTAREARDATVGAISKLMGAAEAAKEPAEQVNRLRKLREDVAGLQEGAFSSALGNPALKAVLLPFTGGGITLLLNLLSAR